MQYQKWNFLHNPPAQYGIYYMNHGKEVYMANHTTLDLVIGRLQLDIPLTIYNKYLTHANVWELMGKPAAAHSL